ncbi:hypothetical protein [Streptomyces sp. H27-D2]|uniref:hypothetical protein n=1 Tax=Streptomyces sp. H27-D2 TaxID=3046304 RepID=UPI002DB84C4B|nr:hypothetical protein [Streptomyces sp. H27-D2]MEC4018127.1 hypothetical protein [Streptomyces sp. H27-D2]
MPRFGQVKGGFCEGSSPARQEFAARFSSLIDAIPDEKQKAKAQKAGLRPSTLSCYRRARRVPDVCKLERIYKSVQRAATSSRLPVTLPELQELRATAAARHQSTCQTGDAIQRPASPSHIRSVQTAAKVERANAVGTPPAGDRRNFDKRVQLTLDTLAAHQAAGRRRDVLSLAWSAGNVMTPMQIAHAISELHLQGEQGIAETLLLGGRKRVEGESMRLALVLMGEGLPGYAEMVMRAAITTEAA